MSQARRFRIVLALVMAGIAGCHSTPALNTSSGRPEVIIQNRPAAAILSKARDFFLIRGYTSVPSDNGYKLIFSRRTEKPGAAVSRDNCWRIHLMLSDLGNRAFRLEGTPTKVEGCGGELETEHVMVFAFPQVQKLLEEIRDQVAVAK